MIAAFTGHRPEDLPDLSYVESRIMEELSFLPPDKVIVGMAAGVDLIAAKCAYRSGIPFICAKPWKTHKGRMGGSQGYVSSWEKHYDQAIKYAEEVVDVTDYEDYPGAWVYQTRNEWMVDHADQVWAVWSGKKSGGTYNCVKYAEKQNKFILRIDPSGG